MKLGAKETQRSQREIILELSAHSAPLCLWFCIMKFSEIWLRRWVNPNISTAEMCEQLTMAGLEVDSVTPVAGEFDNVVIARVDSVDKHPDANKLNVCQVSDGQKTYQVVCGASNVREGLIVPLARIGAVLPGNFEIKAAKLRGVESHGMLCSEKELGIAEESDGLMELSIGAPIGRGLRDYLRLDDNCIEIDLTPNRGDCLSIAGIAREIAALNQVDVTEVDCSPRAATVDDTFPVEILADEACTHYVGRAITDIDPRAETPIWMVERLRRSGIRSLGPVVDITNYVMLELGQPMHAFDLETLTDGIRVRFANDKEHITLLDGKTLELDNQSLVIADHKKVLALAGIMGAEGSGITDDTSVIFLESAFFKPEAIAGKARAFGLHTDSSHRFERGVDPQLQTRAIERATQLVLSICGGFAGPIVECETQTHQKESHSIDLRAHQVKRLLGIDLKGEDVAALLERLGMEVRAIEGGWRVLPPSFRFDMEIEADLLEELVRLYGYNNIPRTQPAQRSRMRTHTECANSMTTLRSALVNRGYFEAITYSFVDPNIQQLIDPEAKTVKLENPISSEMSEMRSTLWPGLIQALRYNHNHQHQRVRLFESGMCFRKGGDDVLEQVDMIAGIIAGDLYPEQWGEVSRRVDFYDIKSDVEALLDLTGLGYTFEAAQHPALHPGQSARVTLGDQALGWVGALHPELMGKLDIEHAAYLFEFHLEGVRQAVLPEFTPLSRFPEVRRDLAIVVDKSVTSRQIQACIHDNSSDLLRSTQIFDVYTGKGVDQGRKSVALGLILQDFSRTLTDLEIDSEIEKIVSTLKLKLAATLRE